MRKASFRKSNVALTAVLQAAVLMLLPCCASMQRDVPISADSARDGEIAPAAALEPTSLDAAVIGGGKKEAGLNRESENRRILW